MLVVVVVAALFVGTMFCFLSRSAAVLAPIVPVLVSTDIIGKIAHVSEPASLQKAAVLAGCLILWMVVGIGRMPRPVLALCAFLLAEGFLALARPAGNDVPVHVDATAATLGYLYIWLLTSVRWDRVAGLRLMRALQVAPFLALLVGVALQVLGIDPLMSTEYTGVPRLHAGLAAPYLASFAMFGTIASMWRWLSGDRRAWLIGGICLGITLATGSRGPSIVGAGVFMFVLILFPTPGIRSAFTARAISALLGVVVLAELAPLLVQRTLNEGAAQGLLSGRGSAWRFFWDRFLEHPWLGNGIGANSSLGGESTSAIVRGAFKAPHNTYLQFLVDFGIVGSTFLIVLLLLVFRHYVRLIEAPAMRRFALLVGAFLAMYAFFDNLFASPHPAVAYVLLLVGMAQAGSVSRPVPQVPSGGSPLTGGRAGLTSASFNPSVKAARAGGRPSLPAINIDWGDGRAR